MPTMNNALLGKSRAWIELNMDNLRHNVDVLKAVLPPDCELMPAVKANAYGHGAVLIAKELNAVGVKALCVASADEGAELRRHEIQGVILILGYTPPEQFYLLNCFDLTQTVVDYEYAKLINSYALPIRVHIGIDTGMHRLGERSENIERIREMFDMENLKIDGLFTHLCADDTDSMEARLYTLEQANRFGVLIEQMHAYGLDFPKVHLLSSYGLLNYPELGGNYARIGIALYGLLSTREDTKRCKLDLMPVLSVKARVSLVRQLHKGEYAGYGLAFCAEKETKIAVLTIGYADGLPRSLSCGTGKVLIDGCEAPIVGRICMDQTLVDVSGISNVKTGDVAVIIGASGEKEINACDVAEQTNTIANEVLSRLGSRLIRIPMNTYCDGKSI